MPRLVVSRSVQHTDPTWCATQPKIGSAVPAGGSPFAAGGQPPPEVTMARRIVEDSKLLPALVLCESGKADECTPSQLFAMCMRSWLILGVEGDGHGGVLMYTGITHAGRREVELFRKMRGLPPPTPDESGQTT